MYLKEHISLLTFSSSPGKANMYSVFCHPCWMWLLSFEGALDALTDSVSREGCRPAFSQVGDNKGKELTPEFPEEGEVHLPSLRLPHSLMQNTSVIYLECAPGT